MKFKYGIAAKGKGGKKGRKGGKGGKGSDVATGKYLLGLTKDMNKIRVPKTTGAPSSKVNQPTLKRTPLKTYTVAKKTQIKPTFKRSAIA